MEQSDHEWLQRELEFVVDHLSRSFPAAPPERIRATVNEAVEMFVSHASISTFLPILVQRRAHDRLSAGLPEAPPAPRSFRNAVKPEEF